jgi:hypothetical protein
MADEVADTMVTDRKERIARNEVLFREVNERIRDVPLLDSSPEETTGFLCECGDATCTETVLLTLAEYEEVRAHSTHFAVLPGHVVPDVEDIVSEGERFFVVSKHLEEAAPALETDPRA